VPQLKAAIAELQSQGFALPDYPDDPQTDEERDIRARYDKVKGSAVNPVLREGNSDRRAPAAVKNYARKPPALDGRLEHRQQDQRRTWAPTTSAPTSSPSSCPATTPSRSSHVATDGTSPCSRTASKVLEGEVVDATVMRAAPWTPSSRAGRPRQGRGRAVLGAPQGHDDEGQRPDHLRPRRARLPARGVRAHGADLDAAGLSPNNGLGGILDGLAALPNGAEIKAAIEQGLADGPRLAMVNSDKGITNLHVPSDVIVDASMPAMIRTSGHMWGPDGAEADTLAVIPDSSYAGVYQTVIDDCRVNGAFDPTTMGSVPNVGLMAQKAEEYGSHDKTFEISDAGRVEVVDGAGTVLMSHDVAPGDIWRACQTKDARDEDDDRHEQDDADLEEQRDPEDEGDQRHHPGQPTGTHATDQPVDDRL
jgi:isocitrate dehydrogenase